MTQRLVRVSDDPVVELNVVERAGLPDRTLLVIHGGPDWDHSYLVEPLVHLPDAHLIFVDLRGCGGSTRGLSPSDYTPTSVTADLVRLLDVLDLGVVDVLGFSYGGLIAQRLVAAAPARVRRLILASTSVLPIPADAFVDRADVAERTVLQDPAPPEDQVWTPVVTHSEAQRTAPTNVWNLQALPEYLQRLKVIEWSAEWARPWKLGILPDARLDKPVEVLRAAGLPILQLQGEHDMTFPAEALVGSSILPKAQIVVLENAGHMAHVDQPDAWLDAISRFFAPEESTGPRTYGRTSDGREIDDRFVAALADEAERGYTPEQLEGKRHGRGPVPR